jgi:uncharacterized integral membrane protein
MDEETGLEREPHAASDPEPEPLDPAAPGEITRSSEEPQAELSSRQGASFSSERVTAQAAPRGPSLRPWLSLGSALVLLVLLVIFIAENSRSVKVSFLGAHGSMSLALELLIAAVVGAALALLIGVASVLRFRVRARRARQLRQTR